VLFFYGLPTDNTQAIVDGEPPGLPEEGYSAMAHDFVKGCLNKTPSARPTYAMLLGHPWIAPLAKPLTIEEEEEGSDKEKEDQKDGEADGADGADGVDGVDGQPAADGVDGVAQTIAALKITSGTDDEEVAAWVRGVLDKQRAAGSNGLLARPALHAAPLDSVSPAPSPVGGGRLE
jgi:mitogen-activated protein kinase kinase